MRSLVPQVDWGLSPVSPYLTGAATGAQMVGNILQRRQQMRAEDLANQAAAQRLHYLQPSLQQQLQANVARTQLLQAQAERQRALARDPYLGMQTQKVIPTAQGYMIYDLRTGMTRPLTTPTGAVLHPMQRGGMQISATPGGGYTITTGGLVPATAPTQTQGGAPIQSGSTPTDAGGNIQLSPASPHSRYSTGGGTLLDTQTGNATSIPTKSTASGFQKSLVAERLVPPVLQKIYSDISPLVGASNWLNRGMETVGQALGKQEPELAAYRSAINTEIPQVADQMLKAYGLNNTEGNRLAMQHSLDSKWYDTANSYARRISDSLAQMLLRDKAYTNVLRKGIPLQDKTKKDRQNLLQGISDGIYENLTGHTTQHGDMPDRVVVRAPDGSLHTVPRVQLELAKKRGYEEVQ